MTSRPQDNGTGCTDAHVHVNSAEGAEQLLAAGVRAVRNAGTAGPSPFNAGPLIVINSRSALYKKGGYGARFGIAVEDRPGIVREIARLKQAGADIIKVMASGIVSLKSPGRVTAGGFDREELALIVEAAARQGLAVMAHANGESAIRAAAEAGVRSIEHGFFMTERALEAMAGKRVFWTPTAGALVRAGRSPALPPAAEEFLSRVLDSHIDMIRLASHMGVQLALGTDCVLPDPGYSAAYAAELEFFEQAGLSKDQVAAVAGSSGALLLGLRPDICN